jgi:hypothetical protein
MEAVSHLDYSEEGLEHWVSQENWTAIGGKYGTTVTRH